MKNEILHGVGKHVLLDISTPKYPCATTWMDIADLSMIKGRISLGAQGYPMVRQDNKLHYVHRLLNPRWSETDHINGNRTDNRRVNLRPCTRSQNNVNLRSSRGTNTSGKAGVGRRKDTGKWRAYIRVNGKDITLGSFDHKDDAVRAREEAEQKHYGDFAPSSVIGRTGEVTEVG